MPGVLAALERRAGSSTPSVLHFEDAHGPVPLAAVLAGAQCVGAGLAGRGVPPGEPVAVLARRGHEFLTALFGVWYAGAVPVPLPLPFGGIEAYVEQMRHMAHAAGIRHLAVGTGLERGVRRVTGAVPRLRAASLRELAGAAPGSTPPRSCASGGDLAVVQFTSGSTGSPKPVALSHRNVLAGVEAIALGLRSTPDDVLACALPLYHDMGLFGSLHALLHCGGLSSWSPQRFLRDPAGWLDETTRIGCTQVPAPNFVLEALTGVCDDLDPARVDLTSWRAVVHGAQSVDHTLLEHFRGRFARFGLSGSALRTAYGLAEATVAVTFSPPGRSVRTRWTDRRGLAVSGRARQMADRGPDARPLVSLGRPVPGIRVRITRHGAELEPGLTGEIEIAGAPVAAGYYPAGRANALPRWVRTGDSGFQYEGELYVVGRTADLIPHGAASWPAEDLEDVAARLPGVWRRRCVAIAVPRGAGLVAETDTTGDERSALAARLADLIGLRFGIRPVRVWLLAPGQLPQTSSGKWRRFQVRAQAAAGTLGTPLAVRLPVRAPARNPWVAVHLARPLAGRRLYCLPFAGGAAAYYGPWARGLPQDTELRAVQLPGRHSRRAERLIDSLPELVLALADNLEPELDEHPFAFFGHSLGALLAFELARELRRRGAPMPGLLAVSGCAPPHELPSQAVSSLVSSPDQSLWEDLRAFGGIPLQLAAEPQLRDIVVPVLRADLRAMAGYRFRQERPLDCPVTVLGGRADTLVPEAQLAGWSRHFTGPVTLRAFDGGHFYLTGNGAVLRTLTEDMDRHVPAPGPFPVTATVSSI